jgi:hypothetical protein
MEAITAVVILPNVDHPAGDDSVAKDTDAPIIERIPFAITVGFLEHGQSIRQSDVSVHSGFVFVKQEINFIARKQSGRC